MAYLFINVLSIHKHALLLKRAKIIFPVLNVHPFQLISYYRKHLVSKLLPQEDNACFEVGIQFKSTRQDVQNIERFQRFFLVV